MSAPDGISVDHLRFPFFAAERVPRITFLDTQLSTAVFTFFEFFYRAFLSPSIPFPAQHANTSNWGFPRPRRTSFCYFFLPISAAGIRRIFLPYAFLQVIEIFGQDPTLFLWPGNPLWSVPLSPEVYLPYPWIAFFN